MLAGDFLNEQNNVLLTNSTGQQVDFLTKYHSLTNPQRKFAKSVAHQLETKFSPDRSPDILVG
jgi:hypothetical protein